MTGFLLLRVRAHRLLLVAALLAVVLTASVLAALAAFSGSVGDAALRSTLTGRAAASAALVVEADGPREEVAREAREAFDGLPVTVRTLERSTAYALPGSPQGEQPDLTFLAA
ncbi:ABC transporter permease, partial [Streptomyces sp. NPDC002920]